MDVCYHFIVALHSSVEYSVGMEHFIGWHKDVSKTVCCVCEAEFRRRIFYQQNLIRFICLFSVSLKRTKQIQVVVMKS